MGAIGDVICTVPAVRSLYEQGFEIHWVCGQAARPLLDCYSWIHVISVDDRVMLRGALFLRLKEIIGFWRRIVGKKWTLTATLYFDWRYRVLALPVRTARKIALSQRTRETSLITVRSYSDEFARILLGEKDHCRPQGLNPLRPDRLPGSPVPRTDGKTRIAIVPGGTSNLISEQVLRRWPIGNYVSVARELANRGWEIVILGGPEDTWVRPYFEGIDVTDCVAKFSIPEVISLCDTCDAVVTHDTGPMHMAGLSGACIVAIFGPTNPGHVLPRRPGVTAIWGGKNFACRPCYDLRTYAPCESAGCMQEVSPEDVLREMDRLLDARLRKESSPWQVVFPGLAPGI